MRILARIFALVVLGGGLALSTSGGFALWEARTGFNQVFAAIIIAAGTILFVGGCLMFILVGLRAALEKAIIHQSAALQAQLASNRTLPAAQTVASATAEAVAAGPSENVAPEPVVEHYFYGDPEGHERGPLDLAAIRALVKVETIDDETPIYKSGSRIWGTIADFPELAR
jgi:hypothetical protein